MGQLALRLFIGYQIESPHHRPEEFRRLGEQLEKLLAESVPSICLIPSYGEFPAGAHLWDQVVRTIQSSDAVLLDISENNPNVLLEAGLALGMQKLVIVLRCRDAAASLPVDIGSFVYVPYKTLGKANLGPLAKEVKRGIDEYLLRPRDPLFYFRHLWSLRPDTRTYVVPGTVDKEVGRNPFEDYVHLRGHADLDAVFLVTETLTRLYPQMTVLVQPAESSGQLPEDWREGNVVCVGGPDFNKIVREFDARCPVEYHCDPDDNVWLSHKKTGRHYKPSFRTHGDLQMATDYGFFLKTKLGGDGPGRLVLIGGARTWGVYGAAMLVACRGHRGETGGSMNVKRLVDMLGSDPSFVVTLETRGSVQGVHPPIFREADVETLDDEESYV